MFRKITKIIFFLIFLTFYSFSQYIEEGQYLKDKKYITELIKPYKRKNEARIIDCILKYSYKYGHNPGLIARLIKRESHFRFWLVSHKGAIGIMQVMPQHWLYKMPLTKDGKKFKAKKPYKKYLKYIGINIEIGCMILREHVDEFGSYPLALLCYNRGRSDKSFLLAKKYPFLVWEFDYVKKIMDSKNILRVFSFFNHFFNVFIFIY